MCRGGAILEEREGRRDALQGDGTKGRVPT